jgi:hypothetical protein
MQARELRLHISHGQAGLVQPEYICLKVLAEEVGLGQQPLGLGAQVSVLPGQTEIRERTSEGHLIREREGILD